MQGKLQVRSVNPHQPDEWQLVLTAADPTELDLQADSYRAVYDAINVQLGAKLTRGEKARLTRSVLARDERRCRKCSNTVDAQVVSSRYQEYHNPDKLITLCRICRRARNIILEDPYDETATRDYATRRRGRCGGCDGGKDSADLLWQSTNRWALVTAPARSVQRTARTRSDSRCFSRDK